MQSRRDASSNGTGKSLLNNQLVDKQFPGIVLIELCAGIGPWAWSARSLNVNVVAHYFAEVDEDACHLMLTHFLEAISVGCVSKFDDQLCNRISSQHPGILFVITYGPPCVDVSKFNERRAGAEGPQAWIRKKCIQVHQRFSETLAPERTVGLMECTTMQPADLQIFQRDTVTHVISAQCPGRGSGGHRAPGPSNGLRQRS